MKIKKYVISTATIAALCLAAAGLAQQLQITEGNTVTEQIKPETGSAIAIQCKNIAQPTPKQVTLSWQVGSEPVNKWVFSGEGRDRDGLMNATRKSGQHRRTLNEDTMLSVAGYQDGRGNSVPITLKAEFIYQAGGDRKSSRVTRKVEAQRNGASEVTLMSSDGTHLILYYLPGN